MKIKDLFTNADDHLQVILTQAESGELDANEIKKRVHYLVTINMALINTLPPAFKELEVFRRNGG